MRSRDKSFLPRTGGGCLTARRSLASRNGPYEATLPHAAPENTSGDAHNSSKMPSLLVLKLGTGLLITESALQRLPPSLPCMPQHCRDQSRRLDDREATASRHCDRNRDSIPSRWRLSRRVISENGNGDGISNHDMFGRASEMQQNPLSTCVVQWRRRTRKHQINNHAVRTQARIHAARESHATNSNETADAPLGSAGSGRHLVMMAQSCDSARLFV